MRIKVISASAMGVLMASGWASASTIYDKQLDQSKFGHIDQSTVPANGPGVAGENSCAPTATMNSFQYLNTAFPSVYGTNGTNPALQGTSASWTAAAIDLAQNYMGTTNASGTTENNWINGKRNYLEAKAPGKTTYGGQDSVGQGGAASNVQNANPDPLFLYNALNAGADIEIGISPPGNGIGHVMTLTSIHWVDEDMNNVFNAGDTLTLDGIDPAGGTPFVITMTPPGAAGGTMGITGGTYDGYRLDAALTETAVPEPAASVVLLAAMAGVGLRRRTLAR